MFCSGVLNLEWGCNCTNPGGRCWSSIMTDRCEDQLSPGWNFHRASGYPIPELPSIFSEPDPPMSCGFSGQIFILTKIVLVRYSSVQFSRSVVSDSLHFHGLQHARLPCPSPTTRVCSNSCPSSQWCHSTIWSSVAPFFSCLQSFPASQS